MGFNKIITKFSVIIFETEIFEQRWFARDGHRGLQLIFMNANM